MITVSKAWREAQKQMLLPETFVELSYMITDPGVQKRATISGSDPESFSNTDQVLDTDDKKPEKYATLEWGGWGLDGSFEYRDDSSIESGYVSKNFSTEDAVLITDPILTINFAEKQTVMIPGLTITWSEAFLGWATDFTVRAYDRNVIVAQSEITGNKGITSVVWLDMVDYTKIEIEVLKWSHPLQRVRCSEIILGIRQIYDKGDLLKFEQHQSVDLLSAALPENKLTFHLRNDDGRWNPDHPSSFEKYLTEQQEIRVRFGMDLEGSTEWIKGGTFWLSERRTPSNGLEAVFIARGATEFMNVTYTGSYVGTIYDIAIAALEEADIPTLDDGSVRYNVSEKLKDYSVDMSGNDYEYTVAEVLQMLANAGDCVFYQDREGMIRIEPWDKAYSNYMIEPHVSYSHPEYTISKPLKAVSVGYGGEQRAVVNVASRGEVQTLDNPFISTEEDAFRVANTTTDVLKNRKVISGDFRADLILDALDNVIVVSKYASNVIGITDITYSTTGGAFQGKYTGRVVSPTLNSETRYSNEFYVGEI